MRLRAADDKVRFTVLLLAFGYWTIAVEGFER